jgi:hypothetical protein
MKQEEFDKQMVGKFIFGDLIDKQLAKQLMAIKERGNTKNGYKKDSRSFKIEV